MSGAKVDFQRCDCDGIVGTHVLYGIVLVHSNIPNWPIRLPFDLNYAE